MPRQTPDGKPLPVSAQHVSERHIGAASIMQELAEKVRRAESESQGLGEKVVVLEQQIVELKTPQEIQIAEINVLTSNSVLFGVRGLRPKLAHILAKFDDDNISMFYYDINAEKTSASYEPNLATAALIYRELARYLTGPAFQSGESVASASRLTGRINKLEEELQKYKNLGDASGTELRLRDIAKTQLVSELDDARARLQDLDANVLQLENFVLLSKDARLQDNGFVVDFARDGRSVKILINEAGAYYVDGDNLEELADSDPLNILSEIFGKHYAAFVKQEADLSDRIGVVKQKETELLAAMGVKEGELNINRYNNNVDAALGLLEKIQNVTRAKTQAHTNFVSRLNAVLLKTAKDFEIGDDIISSYRSKLGSDSSAAVAYLLEAVKKAGQNAGLAHRAADYFKGLAEKIDVDFASRLAGKSDDDIVKASTVLILEYIGTRKKEEKNTAAAQQAIRNSWADYISRLAGLPVDAGSLDASNAGSLQDLLNSAIKKKRAEWQFGILKEIYEKLPENYGHGLPENAELGVGIDRLARDLEQLAQDAQEAKAAKAEAELAKQRAINLESTLQQKDIALKSKDIEVNATKQLMEATKEITAAKEAHIKDKLAMLEKEERLLDDRARIYEQQLAERDGKLLDAARQLSEKEQQIQALEQELRAKAAQDKRPAKIVKKTVRKQGEETVPETPLEETEQRPPAV